MKKNLTLFFIVIFSNAFSQFTQTVIISNLQYPVAFDWMPNGNYLVTLKGTGSQPSTNAKIQVYSPTGTFLNTFYDLSDSANSDFERGVLGVCVDPSFNNNHFVYVYYNHNFNGDERIRIIKFTEAGNVGTNPVLILDQDVSNTIPGNHVGGNVHMHTSEPDKLYFTIGELANSANAQMLTNPYGKVSRINTDGSIPTDNPFYDDGNPLTGNDDRIWSYGHRNPFDFCFSTVNDSLYNSENGASTWDEANIVRKGANYGWNVCEGNYLNGSTTTPCTNPAFTNPLTEWNPLPAVTGIMVYNSSVIPQLNTHLLVAGNNDGNIYDCTLGNAPAYNTVTNNVLWKNVSTSLTTLRQGSDGCVYAMKGGYTTTGAIYRICPSGLNTDEHPSNLIETEILPNPSAGSVKIQFNLNKNDHVKIIITDVTMRLVAVCLDTDENSGPHVINFDSSNLQSGTYFCHINLTGEKKTLKMIVIK
jgi:glucose/arabinose dehydrogenase